MAARPCDALTEQCPAKTVMVPGIGDRDRHLRVGGVDRLEAEMTDDRSSSVSAQDLGHEPFAVLVVRPAEESSGEIADPVRGAKEPRLARIVGEIPIEPPEGCSVGWGDRPDLDFRWWRRLGHGNSVTEGSTAHQVRMARMWRPTGRCWDRSHG